MEAAIALGGALYPGRLSPQPGRLFAWGKTGGKGGNALPVPPAAVDKAGDCVFPAQCQLPKGTGAVFIKASVDVGPFCALDATGRAWAWSGWAQKGGCWSAGPQPVADGCIDCAAGAGFIVVAKADGSMWMLGKAPSPTPLPDARGGWVELSWATGGPVAVAVDACDGVVLAASADGSLFSAGQGVALGHSKSGAASVFAQLLGLPPVCAFSVGSLSGCCGGRDGTVWTWGDGTSGNLVSSRAICRCCLYMGLF